MGEMSRALPSFYVLSRAFGSPRSDSSSFSQPWYGTWLYPSLSDTLVRIEKEKMTIDRLFTVRGRDMIPGSKI